MKGFVSKILSLIYPPHCPFCGEIYPDGICPSCKSELSNLENTFRYYTRYCTEYNAPYLYYDLVRTGLIRIKFYGKAGEEEWLAREMVKALPSGHFDGIISVPPYSKGRRDERDISDLLSLHISKLLGLPYFRNAAVKIKDTPPQHKLTRMQRYYNLKDAFVVEESSVKGKNILICDDIITTGSTINELAKACKDAGARKVYAVSLALTPIREHQKDQM